MNRIVNFRIILTMASLLMAFNLCAREYNITGYGSISDTTVLSTKAIQAAIDDCSRNNGGKVIIPAGSYLTGTLYFKSNVTILLEQGATLYGSAHLSDYPVNQPDYNFFRKGVVKHALIYAENCTNISIEGEGMIDGQGGAFWVSEGPEVNSYSVRPYLIWMIQCKNVRIEGIKLRNSAFWMQHYLACDKVYIHNIDVFNHCNKNNDMIDIDGCHDVIISDCAGDTDDDGLTLKSTSGRASENIVITNCLLSSHCNALKMGTESNTGFKNITISNIVVRPSKIADKAINGRPNGIAGIALEMVDGGILDGVVISNIHIDGADCPIFIRLGNRARPYMEGHKIDKVGGLQNISISNVIATNAKKTGCSISGIPGFPVQNINLSHISIEFDGGGTKDDFMREIPEQEKSYPESDMFDLLPSYGFFIRHAQNVRFSDIQLRTKSEDLRPALFVSDVQDADFDKLCFTSCSNNISDICLEHSKRIRISECSIKGHSNCLLSFKGDASANITVINNILTNVKSLYAPGQKPKNGLIEYGNMK
jgi:polygalacturonase